MKKYLLTALLGVFGLFGFTSADSVDGFTSSSEICKISNFNGSTISNTVIFDCYSDDVAGELQYEPFYVCVNTNDIPYYADDEENYIDSSIGCFYSTAFSSDSNIYFLSDVDNRTQKIIQGDVYLSTSSITYSSSSEGGDSGGSLLPGGEGDLSGIISGLNSVIDEFLPYLVYIGLGLITSTIGFIAVRWLVGRTSSKVRGTFSSGKRRR